jgi:DNA polymerase-3 subunit gamma/tau
VPESAAQVAPADAASAQWSSILSQLELSGAARQLASHCVLLGREGAVVRLALDPARAFVSTPALQEKLAQALSRHFGESVRLEFESTAAAALSPARVEEHASLAQLAAARESLESDPGVQALRERFGATLLPDTVRPIK